MTVTTPAGPGGPPISDSELAALALADTAGDRVADDAVPVAEYLAATAGCDDGTGDGLLPGWYMPAPRARAGGRWRVALVVALVATFVALEALGLCTAYGHVVVG